MARVNVPVTLITRAGVQPGTPVVGDATNNHIVVNNGRTWLEVENAGATSRVLTINIAKTVDGQTPAAKTYSLAAGAFRRIGPFPTDIYGASINVDVAHLDLKLTAYTLNDR
ncbi:hypothetical protein [Embleya sp. NPDC001921]